MRDDADLLLKSFIVIYSGFNDVRGFSMIENDIFFLENLTQKCNSGHELRKLTVRILQPAINIFLKNFVKDNNDTLASLSSDGKRPKLTSVCQLNLNMEIFDLNIITYFFIHEISCFTLCDH